MVGSWLFRHRFVVAGLAIAVSGGFQISDMRGQNAQFGSQEEVAYSGDLWRALNQARLVGTNAIESFPYKGTDPHGAMLQTLKTRVSVRGQEGEVIVKRNFGPGSVSASEVWANPDRHLAAVTVMFRRAQDYDPGNKNWFWVKYNPDGSLDQTPQGMRMAGKVVGCITCHRAAAGDDLVYSNDK